MPTQARKACEVAIKAHDLTIVLHCQRGEHSIWNEIRDHLTRPANIVEMTSMAWARLDRDVTRLGPDGADVVERLAQRCWNSEHPMVGGEPQE